MMSPGGSRLNAHSQNVLVKGPMVLGSLKRLHDEHFPSPPVFWTEWWDRRQESQQMRAETSSLLVIKPKLEDLAWCESQLNPSTGQTYPLSHRQHGPHDKHLSSPPTFWTWWYRRQKSEQIRAETSSLLVIKAKLEDLAWCENQLNSSTGQICPVSHRQHGRELASWRRAMRGGGWQDMDSYTWTETTGAGRGVPPTPWPPCHSLILYQSHCDFHLLVFLLHQLLPSITSWHMECPPLNME